MTEEPAVARSLARQHLMLTACPTALAGSSSAGQLVSPKKTLSKRPQDGLCPQCRNALPPVHLGKGQQKVYCDAGCRKKYHAASNVAAAVEEARRDAFAERERFGPSAALALTGQRTHGHIRLSFLIARAVIDEKNATAYNALHMPRGDHWDEEKLAWEVSFAHNMDVFQPLMAVAKLPRSTRAAHQGHVLLHTHPEVYSPPPALLRLISSA